MPNSPEDIFEEIDPSASPREPALPFSQNRLQSSDAEPETPLRQDVMAEGGGTLSPHERMRPSPPPPPPTPAPLPPDPTPGRSTTIRINNRVLLWGLFLLILAVLLGIVLWMFTDVLRQSISEEDVNKNVNVTSNTNTPPATSNTSSDNINAVNTNTSVVLDSDQDGLTTEEEVRLGTDPQDPDSDHDSLSDLMETTHQTDPLNPDSDHDGYLDGIEVRAGYNPLGPGRLDISKFLQNES
jgi:hypothetical protein